MKQPTTIREMVAFFGFSNSKFYKHVARQFVSSEFDCIFFRRNQFIG